MNETPKTSQIIEELFAVIESRKGGDPKVSHTAKLFAKGRGKIAKKTGEEAVEVIVAALHETPDRVVSESADLLYHLMVLWADQGIGPAEVFAELERRVGVSGIEEKKSRT
ncbi:MAG: phosphoribosyl-ATP diphosphatase [Proteobacteria bacterium]|nr:phosphoribosyl-ATP diphosphatase [Pseudomonadota bacterium]